MSGATRQNSVYCAVPEPKKALGHGRVVSRLRVAVTGRKAVVILFQLYAQWLLSFRSRKAELLLLLCKLQQIFQKYMRPLVMLASS